ncbi:MAG: AfsR/SARP family transcriptional regulator [Pseudonocardiaceae bacterium]
MFSQPAAGSLTAPGPARRAAPTLRLFGGFRLEYAGTNVTVSLNGQRLLAFLGIRGNTTRAGSAGTLWPEATEGRAHGSLRTTIWRLHRIGTPLVDSHAGVLTLAPDVRVDVHEFTAAAARIQRSAESDGEQIQVFTTGELLPGWYDDWLLFERERLRQIRLHALEALVRQLTVRGQYARALDAALQCVQLEPLRESAHRAVLQIHLAEHNIAEALRHYELFRRFLREELGIEPSPELRDMLAARDPYQAADMGPSPKLRM